MRLPSLLLTRALIGCVHFLNRIILWLAAREVARLKQLEQPESIPPAFWKDVEFHFDPFKPPAVGTKCLVPFMGEMAVAEYMGKDEDGALMFTPIYTNVKIPSDQIEARRATKH